LAPADALVAVLVQLDQELIVRKVIVLRFFVRRALRGSRVTAARRWSHSLGIIGLGLSAAERLGKLLLVQVVVLVQVPGGEHRAKLAHVDAGAGAIPTNRTLLFFCGRRRDDAQRQAR